MGFEILPNLWLEGDIFSHHLERGFKKPRKIMGIS